MATSILESKIDRPYSDPSDKHNTVVSSLHEEIQQTGPSNDTKYRKAPSKVKAAVRDIQFELSEDPAKVRKDHEARCERTQNEGRIALNAVQSRSRDSLARFVWTNDFRSREHRIRRDGSLDCLQARSPDRVPRDHDDAVRKMHQMTSTVVEQIGAKLCEEAIQRDVARICEMQLLRLQTCSCARQSKATHVGWSLRLRTPKQRGRSFDPGTDLESDVCVTWKAR